jgi:LEA14-like dessication related protein
MEMRKLLLVALVCAFSASSCDVMKQVGGSLNMVNCTYEFNSITGLSLAGINVSEGLSLPNIARATSLLTGNTSSIPLNMTINIDVKNPNATAALLSGMQYVLSIDGVEFTTGSIARQFNVPPGQTGVLPLTVGFDLAGLLAGETRDAVSGAVMNLIGIGDRKSNVSLRIRPSFLVGNYTVTSPVFIPIDFSFGGRQS